MFDIDTGLDLQEKLTILSDAAKYDVACTSSGVDRAGKKGHLGNSCAAGICHSFAADGRCVSLLKILMTNHCIYDCKYCLNRVSNDVPRAIFTPDEICTLTIEFYKRNYIEGLFLSSGVIQSPGYTMELICQTLRLLRTKYKFNGYIHVKAIPGAPRELIDSAGLLADRISINLELPTAAGIRALAPNKNFNTILTPMAQISGNIAGHRLAIGKDARMERSKVVNNLSQSIFKDAARENPTVNVGATGDMYSTYINGDRRPRESSVDLHDDRHTNANAHIIEGQDHIMQGQDRVGYPNQIKSQNTDEQNSDNQDIADVIRNLGSLSSSGTLLPAERRDLDLRRPFAPAGQSTQMIIGATGETDLQLIHTTETLYKAYDLKRVFYSAYIPLNEDPALPSLGTPAPLLREHRLYQSDFLMRYYGFRANELLSPERPFFNDAIDPKCDWAVRHLDIFPVEINTASYDTLLRVPGIGPKSVQRIVSARRYGHLTFPVLKKMGVVLKRAQYFITCGGQMLYKIPIEERFITNCLVDSQRKDAYKITDNTVYTQMNLFTDFGLQA